MRVRIRSSASLNVSPGKVVEAIVLKLETMNYEFGRTKTVVVSAVLSGVKPKFISFCAETAHATVSAISTASKQRVSRGGHRRFEGKRAAIQDYLGETPKPTRETRVLPYGFGGAAGFAASPGFGGAPPAVAGPPGRSSSGTARNSCSTNDSG